VGELRFTNRTAVNNTLIRFAHLKGVVSTSVTSAVLTRILDHSHLRCSIHARAGPSSSQITCSAVQICIVEERTLCGGSWDCARWSASLYTRHQEANHAIVCATPSITTSRLQQVNSRNEMCLVPPVFRRVGEHSDEFCACATLGL